MARKVRQNLTGEGLSSAGNEPTGKSEPISKTRFSPVLKLCAILAILSFLVYANTIQNSYALDDLTVITQNETVKKGFAGIPELLTTPRLQGFKNGADKESYRPVSLITYAIEYGLFGLNAAEGHLLNVLIFAGCVIALFLFLNGLFNGMKTGVAFIASLLFALHPIHTEVVANIKSRDELLCFLFALLSLNLFVKYAMKGMLKHLLTGTGVLLLSFLSKETVISFVLIIPLIFLLYVNENNKRSGLIIAASTLAAIVFLAIRASILGIYHSNAILFIANPLVAVQDPFVRIATAIYVLGSYLKLLFVPYPLICDYGYNSIPLVGFGNVWVLLSFAIYLLLAIAGIYRLIKFRRDPWAFGILFFLCTLALFSNIPFLIYSEMAERFLFFPSVGFCLFIALAYDRWVLKSDVFTLSQLKKKLALVTIIPVCLVFSWLTVARSAEWKDNCSLFSADLKKSPDDCQLYYCLAAELSQNMYVQEADPANREQLNQESIANFNKAISIYPGFESAHIALGRVYGRLKLFDSAAVHYSYALAINPNSIANYGLADAYFYSKRFPESIEFYKKMLALEPGLIPINLNLGYCYYNLGRYDSAIEYFNKMLALDPEQAQAKQGLELAYSRKYAQDSLKKR